MAPRESGLIMYVYSFVVVWPALVLPSPLASAFNSLCKKFMQATCMTGFVENVNPCDGAKPCHLPTFNSGKEYKVIGFALPVEDVKGLCQRKIN